MKDNFLPKQDDTLVSEFVSERVKIKLKLKMTY